MVPVTSIVHDRLSVANVQALRSLATQSSQGLVVKNSVPPGFVSKSTTPWSSSPDGKKSWPNGAHFVPSLVPEGHKVSPRHTFVPLRHSQSETDSLFYVVEPRRGIDHGNTPPSSPSEAKKLSPSHTVQTMSTVDSYMSPRSFSSTPDGNRKLFPYLPTRQKDIDEELSSLQRALWVPPRSIDVCRILNDPDRDSPSNLSGSSGSYTARSLHSPQGRKKAILSPKVDHDPIRKSRIKTEMCLHFINKTSCPFGSNCTYAHGEEELQLTRLMDLHEAGLVDAATYRTVPCLTFVSTGSWYVQRAGGMFKVTHHVDLTNLSF